MAPTPLTDGNLDSRPTQNHSEFDSINIFAKVSTHFNKSHCLIDTIIIMKNNDRMK